jgi:hypothetical protein
MPRNGSNVYSPPPGTTATPNTTIASATFNAYVADITQDLNTARAVVVGGTGATDADDAAVNLGLISAKDLAGVNTVGGSATAITITTDRGYTAYSATMLLSFVAIANSTDSGATIDVDGVGAKPLKKFTTAEAAIVEGDILDGGFYTIRYEPTFNSGAGAFVLTQNYGTFTAAEIAVLQAFGAVTAAADKLAYFTSPSAMDVADFTAFARTLIAAANKAAAQDVLGVAMRVVETKTLSGETEAVFSTGFSSDYDEYIFQFIGVRVGTDNSSIFCQLSENGGAGYLTGYGYQTTWDNASTEGRSGADAAGAAMVLIENVDTLASSAFFGKASLLVTTTKAGLTAEFNSFDNTGANNRNTRSGGSVSSTSRVNAVRFTSNTGVTMTGTIRMLAIKNS